MATSAVSAEGYVEVRLKNPDEADVLEILRIAWRNGFKAEIESKGNDREITVYYSGPKAIEVIADIARAAPSPE